MNNTPLNPDARRAAFEAVQAIDGPASIGSMEIVDAAVSAYLAVAQPETHGAKWWIERANVNDWEDCEACLHHDDMCPVHYGINHVAEAVAQPEVTSAEELAKAWHTGFCKGEQTAFRERPVNPDTINPYKNGEKP